MDDSSRSNSAEVNWKEWYEDAAIQRDVADEAARTLREENGKCRQKILLIEQCIVELGETVKGIHEKCDQKLNPPFPLEKAKMVEQVKTNPLRLLRTIKQALLSRDRSSLTGAFFGHGPRRHSAVRSRVMSIADPSGASVAGGMPNEHDDASVLTQTPLNVGRATRDTLMVSPRETLYTPQGGAEDASLFGGASVMTSQRMKRVSDRLLAVKKEKADLEARLAGAAATADALRAEARAAEDAAAARSAEVQRLEGRLREKDAQLDVQLDQLVRLPQFEAEVAARLRQAHATLRKERAAHARELEGVRGQVEDRARAGAEAARLRAALRAREGELRALRRAARAGAVDKLEARERRALASVEELQGKVRALQEELQRVGAVAEQRAKTLGAAREDLDRWRRRARDLEQQKSQAALAGLGPGSAAALAEGNAHVAAYHKGRAQEAARGRAAAEARARAARGAQQRAEAAAARAGQAAQQRAARLEGELARALGGPPPAAAAALGRAASARLGAPGGGGDLTGLGGRLGPRRPETAPAARRWGGGGGGAAAGPSPNQGGEHRRPVAPAGEPPGVARAVSWGSVLVSAAAEVSEEVGLAAAAAGGGGGEVGGAAAGGPAVDPATAAGFGDGPRPKGWGGGGGGDGGTLAQRSARRLYEKAREHEYHDVDAYIRAEMEATEHAISLATAEGEAAARRLLRASRGALGQLPEGQ